MAGLPTDLQVEIFRRLKARKIRRLAKTVPGARAAYERGHGRRQGRGFGPVPLRPLRADAPVPFPHTDADLGHLHWLLAHRGREAAEREHVRIKNRFWRRLGVPDAGDDAVDDLQL